MEKYQVVSLNGMTDFMTSEVHQLPKSAYNGHSNEVSLTLLKI